MNENSSQDLLGYMLGALDPDDHQQIEDQIELDPELKEELQDIRNQIAMLEQLETPGVPPAGLARRACENIAAVPAPWLNENGTQRNGTQRNGIGLNGSGDSGIKAELAANSDKKWFQESAQERSARGRNSVMNFVMVAVVLMLLASIALPVLNNNRFHSRVLACQNNLRMVGTGLLNYADNSGGNYVSMPSTGNLAFAGVYAPKLLDAGYVQDSNAFMCAGVGNAVGREIPSIQDLLSADARSVTKFQNAAGGDFAYTMGQLKDGVYEVGSKQNRENFILLADNPGSKSNDRQSNNHSGYGQNGFFEDGHIQFLKLPEVNGDAIYENDFGGVGPGANPNDIVLVPGPTKLHSLGVD